MKRLLYTTILLSTIISIGNGQEYKTMEIDNPDITLADSVVSLSFEIKADRRSNRHGKTVVYMPMISDGSHTVCFAPAVIRGRRSQIAWERHEWAADKPAGYGDAVYVERGSSVRYKSDIPLQAWMRGADLSAEMLIAGCCSSAARRFLLISEVLPAPEPEISPVPVEIEEPVNEQTAGEEMAELFPFVLPADDYDPVNPLKLYDDERDGGIVIYFRINEYGIVEDYADNRQTLQNLLAAIDIITESEESDVSRVFVAGFASPDGPFQYNDRLAWERAVSVKEYIMRNSVLGDELITLYNGSADWQGLRLAVINDRTMPGRREVLDIIDNHPVWDSRTNTGRLGMMQELQGGAVWKYMAEHLFPKLRNGAFIRVYYNDKKESTYNR